MEAMAHGVRFHGYFKLPEGIFRHFHLISKARRASDCARWSPTVFTTEDFPQAPWLWQWQMAGQMASLRSICGYWLQ
jgi:hypothetical protein